MRRRHLALVLVPLVLVACQSGPDAPPPIQATPGAPSNSNAAMSFSHAGAIGTAVVLERSFAVTREGPGGALPSHVPAVVFTPDGQRLWIGSGTGEVIEFDAATRAVLERSRFSEAAIVAVSIDRDARVLCWLGGGALEARPLDAPVDAGSDGAATLGRVDDVGDARALALSPAGDLAAVGRADGVIEVRRIPGLDVIATVEPHDGAVTGLSFSPDGARLVSTGEDGQLVVSSASDLTELHTVTVSEPLYAACWTPDGAALLYGGHARVVDRLDTTSWRSERLIEGQPYFVTTLGVSPDGTRLAIGDESCDVWIYDLAARAGVFHSKHHVECWLNAVAWAPDSETFLFGCRPNTLAATPALYAQNSVIEAFQDPAHLALVEEERTELRGLIASVEGEEGQEELVALLRRREAQLGSPTASFMTIAAVGTDAILLSNMVEAAGINLQGGGGGGGVLAFDSVEVNQTGVIPVYPAPELGLPSTDPVAAALAALPPDAAPGTRAALERLAAMGTRRAAVLTENVRELSDGFQINVWKAKR